MIEGKIILPVRNNWMLTTLVQSEELKSLGITQEAVFSWFGDKELITELIERWVWQDTTEPANSQAYEERKDNNTSIPIAAAFGLSEIAVMLAYSFVPSNTQEAADKLIEELKNGASTANGCNSRLKEVKSTN